MSEVIGGKISGSATLTGGEISTPSVTLTGGQLSLATIPIYNGSLSVVPSNETQILQTSGKKIAGNIVVDPIPNNYGKVSWNGSYLMVE